MTDGGGSPTGARRACSTNDDEAFWALEQDYVGATAWAAPAANSSLR